MKSLLYRASAILLTICFVSICTISQAQDVSKTFKGVKKIKLNTSAGDCILKKGSNADVQVNLTYTYSDNSFTPVMEQDGTTLTLKEDFNRGSTSGSSKWTLTIPENMDMTFNTGSGNLTVTDLTLEISSNTGSGDLDLQRTNGKFRFNTGSGNAKLEGSKGEVNINAGSGDITATAIEGSLSMNTGSGDIKLTDSKGSFSANTGSGDVTANKLTLADKSSFNSGSGDVEVSLATSPAYDMSLNSGSGDAILDFDGNKKEGTIVMTANKENGEIKAPFSFDKTEELNDKGNQTRIRKTAKLSEKDITIKIGTGSGKAVVEK